jgi:hypothetical protein
MPHIRSGLMSTVVVALAFLPAASPAHAVTATGTGTAQVRADRCRLITFDSAEVVRKEGKKATSVLVVHGYTPTSGATVTLEPVIYIRQPAYWLIQVIGCMPEIGAMVMTPFTATLDLTGTLGTEGIEVAGVDRTQRIRLAVPAPRGDSGVAGYPNGATPVAQIPAAGDNGCGTGPATTLPGGKRILYTAVMRC